MSGRSLTAVVLSTLILVGAGISYTLWSYNRIDAARAASTASWRNLAAGLSERYRQAELAVARGVDQRKIEMEFGERFRLAVDRFRTSAQLHLQYDAAQELEQLMSKQPGLLSASTALAQEVQDYNAILKNLRTALSTPGGRFLSLFLNFANPDDLRLASSD